jgi:hypothetical protein
LVSPVTGGNLTSGLTVGVPYVIVSLGSTTTAQWVTAGVPIGATPAVGLSFIAAATSVAGGGAVKAVGKSGIESIEVCGDPNLSINPSSATTSLGNSSGSYMILQCLNSSGTVTAPAAGSVVGLSFYMNNTAQGV